MCTLRGVPLVVRLVAFVQARDPGVETLALHHCRTIANHWCLVVGYRVVALVHVANHFGVAYDSLAALALGIPSVEAYLVSARGSPASDFVDGILAAMMVASAARLEIVVFAVRCMLVVLVASVRFEIAAALARNMRVALVASVRFAALAQMVLATVLVEIRLVSFVRLTYVLVRTVAVRCLRASR